VEATVYESVVYSRFELAVDATENHNHAGARSRQVETLASRNTGKKQE